MIFFASSNGSTPPTCRAMATFLISAGACTMATCLACAGVSGWVWLSVQLSDASKPCQLSLVPATLRFIENRMLTLSTDRFEISVKSSSVIQPLIQAPRL